MNDARQQLGVSKIRRLIQIPNRRLSSLKRAQTGPPICGNPQLEYQRADLKELVKLKDDDCFAVSGAANATMPLHLLAVMGLLISQTVRQAV